jgi:tellurite resistance protein
MDLAERQEVLRGVLAVALADGKIAASERGVIEGLARKVGVSLGSVENLMEQARAGLALESTMFRRLIRDPERAMKLLVGTAAIDGNISEQERSVLVDLSFKVGLPRGRFGIVFEEGMTLAQQLRDGQAKA